MRPGLRRYLTVFLLAVALVLGLQRSPVLACAMDHDGCRDHCAIVASGCALSCPAPVQPMPVGAVAPLGQAQRVVFASEQPVLHGRAVAPDTGPPRLSA